LTQSQRIIPKVKMSRIFGYDYYLVWINWLELYYYQYVEWRLEEDSNHFRYRTFQSGGLQDKSSLFDMSQSFAENVVIPMPKRKKIASYRSGN
jgi:hypothetical protein